MSTDETELFLPAAFTYPIQIVSVDATSDIQRGTRLLTYSYVHTPRTAGSQPETRFGTWDSSLDGSIKKWNVKKGDFITQRKAKDRPVAIVIEPCKHGMQLAGMCVLCGKHMDNIDYTGYSDASRASIQMTHSADGPTVSLEEAQRIEKETAQHLLKTRKLSLIVDLDQTVIQAAVDPTIGDWIRSGEAWEERKASVAAENISEEEPPNWTALKDVKQFTLTSDNPAGFHAKGKNRAPEGDGCIYFIKPRPGLKDFLEDMATKYEMHVYTMGTRAYAERVCAAVDPEGKIFGRRLLSRDESGSLTQKSLQRLFPCDQSMVVIIDDRADVWEWSPNLIKVIPFDFFVGIGDINSSFLPKIQPLAPSIQPPTPAITSAPLTPEEKEKASQEATAMIRENSLVLEAQVEDRPLEKMQQKLEDASSSSASSTPTSTDTPPTTPSNSGKTEEQPQVSSQPTPEKPAPRALLKNDDVELQRIRKLLDNVHQQFFDSYDASLSQSDKKRKKGSQPKAPNVTAIIPQIRSKVFEGVHILFSSVIPLDTRPESTEIWRMAHMFGAQCSTELTDDITHVVAAKRGTVKVDAARKRRRIKIVWITWFMDSTALWQHLDETPYLLDDPPMPVSASPIATARKLSGSDFDEDEDWDLESTGAAPGTGSLELGNIDWKDVNDEVDAAMNESDDEEDEEGSLRGEGNYPMSEDEGSDSASVASKPSPPASPRPNMKRKRLRSITPSTNGGSDASHGGDDALRSPLSKRIKTAAERSGASPLKEEVNADSDNDSVRSRASSRRASGDGEGDSEEESEDDFDLDDDFLASALEAELG